MKPYINIKMLWMNGGLTEKQRKKVTASMRYSEREGKWIRFGLSVPIYTEMTIPSDGTKTKYLSAILKTVQIAEKEVKYGSTLVLVGTIAATEVVASYLRELFPNKSIATYSSNNSKEDNAKNKMADIVVSTVQSAGTGFDKKGLGKLIVTVPFKSWILADQISGRCRRRDDGKDCYMWELVDKSIPQLRAWANVRADVYRRKSKKFTGTHQGPYILFLFCRSFFVELVFFFFLWSVDKECSEKNAENACSCRNSDPTFCVRDVILIYSIEHFSHFNVRPIRGKDRFIIFVIQIQAFGFYSLKNLICVILFGRQTLSQVINNIHSAFKFHVFQCNSHVSFSFHLFNLILEA